jgi:sulfur carrier protein
MFTIVLNGEKKEIESGVTLDRLLDLFSLPRQRVAIELNKQVIRRQDWENTSVSDSDTIEVIHFVGGG